MTTITIKEKRKFAQTSFNTAKELYIFLKEKLNPLPLFQIEEESLSEESLNKIKKSKANPNLELTDFQG